MATTTSDYLVQRLYDWGVRRVYGYPGDGINGVMAALRKQVERVEFIQARHEEEAAFLACAHAKFTGEVGICIATSGPGAIHLLNGLYDAKLDHQPVVAIVGQQGTTALGSDYQQEVDLISLFKDVAHHYVHMASDPSQIRHLIDRAIRIALAERTVTCVILPDNVQEMEAVESPERKHGTTFTGLGFSRPDVTPARDDLARAAEVLNAGKKVAMLVGAGALGASDEVAIAADILGAGVAKALLGKAVVPDDLPFVTGSIGLLGTKPSWEMMMECDTLLMVGSGFPYSEFLPKEGQARGVQIDISPRMLGLRYPMEVNLQGDSLLTLRALIPLLERKSDRGWRQGIEKNVREWWEIMQARAMLSANPINPQRLFWELSSRLPDNCILTCDSGSAANWYARDVRIRSGMMASLSGGLATMCPGVPYATAAKINHPDRTVVAMVGDGAMQMLGINGLVTISKNWKSWSNPRLAILVLDNKDLNQVTWEQRVMSGDRKFSGSQDIPPFPYARYAEMLGLQGIELDDPQLIGAAWDHALNADRPVVIDAHCDPDVPPLPPHITFEQAKGFMFSLAKGDPNLGGIISQSVKQMMSTLLPRREE
ncbi:2-oxoacid decarboxylase/dehydrogenase, putative [Citrifermentans bemidjiense Bem]|uniref:2-oxoacid decarboxylase/dehydrogenase, putative n=1 Tax=Citrifermentans bemidjiense (strain ATCC BAA-1014 / DSM 16622 / JCM 12645 / Bem) TaxID=404380 RepID=B5EA20_CITBB|nr:thiamine pyrophosphate-requiring protein [Citrifermentans bemidjiense]ACH37318.1 2-oxoacid decarboxylase/dehydrogenase, putative [Citrifermentans bemidjiense Bem]